MWRPSPSTGRLNRAARTGPAISHDTASASHAPRVRAARHPSMATPAANGIHSHARAIAASSDATCVAGVASPLAANAVGPP